MSIALVLREVQPDTAACYGDKPWKAGPELVLPLLDEPEAPVPGDSPRCVVDVENRHYLLVHASDTNESRKSEPRVGQTVWGAGCLARVLAWVAVGMGAAVEPQLREAPVMNEGSWVGVGVHAWSVVAGVIDAGSGELRSLRVCSVSGETVAWLKTLPAPVWVVYGAGPTG